MVQHMKYYFHDHIYGCIVRSHLIILDAKNDKYHLLDPDELHLLNQFVSGSEKTRASNKDQDHHKRLLNFLLENEILSTLPGKIDIFMDESESDVQKIERDLTTELENTIYYTHIPIAVMAIIAAIVLKYVIPFRKTIELLKPKKRISLNIHQTLDDTINIAKSFHSLRVLMPFPRNCYVDSISLIIFLRFFGLHSNLIFGVQISPFYAHCWVEYDKLYLNDRPSLINSMTPILKI